MLDRCAPKACARVGKTAAKLTSETQFSVLRAMLSHKLVWRKKDNKCLLLCGMAAEQGVHRATVQSLLNRGLIAGPASPTGKDRGLFDAIYKLTSAGKKVATGK